MGRSLQELVRGMRNLGVGSTVVRTHGAPVSYIISEARLNGGLEGNVFVKGAQLPLRTAVHGEVSLRQRIPSSLKSDWRLVVDSSELGRDAFVEKSSNGSLRLAEGALDLIRARAAPFDVDEKRKGTLLYTVRQERRATAARLAQKKAEAAAAAAAEAAAAAAAKAPPSPKEGGAAAPPKATPPPPAAKT